MDVLFDVIDFDKDGRIGLADPVGDALGEVYGTVLPASAAKRDHQMAEMPLQIVVNALSDNGFYVIEKHLGLRLGFEIFDHFPITTCFGFELWLAPWIGQCPAIEYETAAVAAEIVGVTLFKRKTIYGYGKVRIER